MTLFVVDRKIKYHTAREMAKEYFGSSDFYCAHFPKMLDVFNYSTNAERMRFYYHFIGTLKHSWKNKC